MNTNASGQICENGSFLGPMFAVLLFQREQTSQDWNLISLVTYIEKHYHDSETSISGTIGVTA